MLLFLWLFASTFEINAFSLLALALASTLEINSFSLLVLAVFLGVCVCYISLVLALLLLFLLPFLPHLFWNYLPSSIIYIVDTDLIGFGATFACIAFVSLWVCLFLYWICYYYQDVQQYEYTFGINIHVQPTAARFGINWRIFVASSSGNKIGFTNTCMPFQTNWLILQILNLETGN
jgi:hypothetical protein